MVGYTRQAGILYCAIMFLIQMCFQPFGIGYQKRLGVGKFRRLLHAKQFNLTQPLYFLTRSARAIAYYGVIFHSLAQRPLPTHKAIKKDVAGKKAGNNPVAR